MKLAKQLWTALLAGGTILASAAGPGIPTAETTAENLKFSGGGIASIEEIGVAGQSFDRAYRVTVDKPAKNPWDAQLRSLSTGPVKEGDAGVIEVWARTLSGVGKLEVLFEENTPPHTKFGMHMLDLSPEWKQYRLPWRCKSGSFAAGATHIGINLGHGGQTFEFAGLKALNYGPSPDDSALGLTKFTYAGREADAPWRKAAEERIEKLRKGDFTLKLVKADGTPLAGAPVKVALKKHHFPFGSAININSFHRQDADGDRYRKEFPRWFNQAVPEISLKWRGGWEYSDRIRRMFDYLEQNGLSVRGHTLVWASWGYAPVWLEPLKDHPQGLRQVIRDHVYYETSMLKDRVVEFDVMNESRVNHEFMDILGDSVMTEWYKTAHEAAPDIRLYMNDYDILSFGNNGWRAEGTPPQIYRRTIADMLAEGAPIGGIGMQGHFSETALTTPETMLDILDSFGEFKLPLKLTEFDLKTDDEQLEADYMRDVMTVFFSHPQGAGFVMWGFWNGCQWTSRAPIFRKDWSLKPAGEMFRKQVFDTWTTRLDGKSGADGNFSGRGFYGEYELETEVDGRSVRQTFRLLPDSVREQTVRLP